MPLEPIICPITQEPLESGHEFTFLSGHTFNARQLAIWASLPQYRTNLFLDNDIAIDTATVSLPLLSIAWTHGIERRQCLGRLFYDDRLQQKLKDVHMSWMQDTPENPLTREPLTSIEKRALANKITLLNHNLWRKKSEFSDTPAPEQFERWSLNDQYDYAETLGDHVESFFNGCQITYWAEAQLSAYAIAILARQLVAIPNKMDEANRWLLTSDKYPSRNPENGFSIIWQLTQRVLTGLAFEERNLAIMNLIKALPKEQQLSFIDLVKELLAKRILSLNQLGRFSDEETGRTLYQVANTQLINEMSTFSLTNHTQEAISGHHGRFSRSGFEAPLIPAPSLALETVDTTSALMTPSDDRSPSRVGATIFGTYSNEASPTSNVVQNNVDHEDVQEKSICVIS